MKKNILVVLLVAVIIFCFIGFVRIYQNSGPHGGYKEISFPQIPDSRDQQYEDSPIVNGHKNYSNPTIGLSFEYPSDWKLDDLSIHGDNEEGSYNNSLMPPDWGQSSNTYISFSHSPLGSANGKSYDNISIEEQFKAYDCSKGCDRLVNPHGVKYIKAKVCDGGCIINAFVPTGKYIMTFDLVGDDLQKISEKEKVFNDLIGSIILR